MPLEFTIDAAPMTTWKIRVFVWSNHKQLLIARRKFGYSENCAAFCWQKKPADAVRHGDECAEIHFDRGDIKRGYITHESYHALEAFKRLVKLDERQIEGEEIAAEAIEHMVESIVWFLKNKKVRVTE